MSRPLTLLLMFAVPLGLAACAAQPPVGPSFVVLPGKGKTLDQFRQDDATCRYYASQSINAPAAAQASTQNNVATAVGGAALGAAAGALIGSASGQAGGGAAIGAGAGLLGGSLVGANNAQATTGSLQRAYDAAYAQCMVAHGDELPPEPNTVAVPYAVPSYPYAYPYPPPVVVQPGLGFGWYWRRW